MTPMIPPQIWPDTVSNAASRARLRLFPVFREGGSQQVAG